MKKLVAIAAVIASLLVTQIGTSSAGAAGAKIKFSVAGASPSSSVLFIGSDVALKVPATAKSVTLSKKFYNSKTRRYSFSIHLVNDDGTYNGPVVFKVTGAKTTGKKKATYSTNVVSRGTMTLGKLVMKSGGWVKAKKVLTKGSYGKLLRNSGTDGKPSGAGRVGVASSSSVTTSGVSSAAGVSCQEIDQTLGTDCDADGVPNAIDADDNNNGVLDIADDKTSDFESQKSLPWSTLYLEIGGQLKNLNANLADITSEDIDEVMATSSGTFSIAFFINMPPGEAVGYDAVWVDCGALAYCARDTGTARTGPPSGDVGATWNTLWCKVALNSAGSCPESFPWTEYTGTIFDQNGQGSKVVSNNDVWNGLTRSINNGESVWAGQLIPNVTTGLLDKVKVADPYILRMRTSAGVVTQRPMSLGAFFVTVPAITSATVGGVTQTVDYSLPKPTGSNQDPFVLGDDGVISLTFYRPQRSAIDGVDPSGTSFMDMGSLRYGMIINGEGGDRSAVKATGNSREFGCSSASGGAYTSIPTSFTRTPDNDPNTEYHQNLWPLTDTFADAVPDKTRTLSVTFDLKACVTALKSAPATRRAVVDMTSTQLVPIQLTAVGIDLEGGASRAAQTFYVRLPSAASAW